MASIYTLGQTVKVKISGHIAEIEDISSAMGRWLYHLKGYGADAWFGVDDLELVIPWRLNGVDAPPPTEGALWKHPNGEIWRSLFNGKSWIWCKLPSWEQVNQHVTTADIQEALKEQGLTEPPQNRFNTPEQWRDHMIEIADNYKHETMLLVGKLKDQSAAAIEQMEFQGIPAFIRDAILTAQIKRLEEIAKEVENETNVD